MLDPSDSNARAETIAEILEDLRFSRVLATLDEKTAALLRSERLSWRIAEIARQQELAGRQWLHVDHLRLEYERLTAEDLGEGLFL